MTMTELHKKTGISQNALSLLANGKSNGVQFNTLEKILTITNTTIDELLVHVGELFTFSVQPTEREKEWTKPNILNYKIIATDSNGEEYPAELDFRISTEQLVGRNVVLIAYSKSWKGFPHQLLNDFFFTARNKGLLKVVSYLVAIDLIKRMQFKDLPLNSLVIFTWFGFVLSDKGELVFTLPLNTDGNINIPDINVLNHEDFIGNIEYDKHLNNYRVETYIK